MSTSIGTAELAAQKSAFADYYRWDVPNRDITVCLNLETANRLQAEVFGSGDSPDDGIEVGGILLGRRERDGERIITFIDDFDLVPCEHGNGPFYFLSASDLRVFQTALSCRRSNADQGNAVVLGFCRSHKRKDIYLSQDDLALIRTSFTEPDNIILLLKVLPGKVCTAGFFFWDNGKIQPEFTDSEFALIPLAQSDFVPADFVSADFVSEEAALASELPGMEAFRPKPSPARSRWIIVASAFIALAGGAISTFLGYQENRNLQPETRGTVVAPHVMQHETTTERPAFAQTSQVAPVATPYARKTNEEHMQKVPAVAGVSRGRSESPVLPAPGSLTREKVPSEPDNAALGTRPDVPEASPSPLIAAPPPLIAASPVVEKAPDISPVQRQALPAAPAVQTPLAQAAPKPQPVETSFTSPQIIHQVAPAIPLGVGPRITTNIQIDVTVTINEVGKVIGARVSSTSGAAAGLLTLEALKAAQLFRFLPAQENNRPVRSDMVLTFRFAPRAK